MEQTFARKNFRSSRSFRVFAHNSWMSTPRNFRNVEFVKIYYREISLDKEASIYVSNIDAPLL